MAKVLHLFIALSTQAASEANKQIEEKFTK